MKPAELRAQDVKEIEIPVTMIWKVQPLEKETMMALLDSRAHMCFISEWKAQSLKMHLEELSKSMQVPVMNVDSTQNCTGTMKYSMHIIIEYKGHQELINFLVTKTSNSNVILGYNWLQRHNPSMDWLNGIVKLNQ